MMYCLLERIYGILGSISRWQGGPGTRSVKAVLQRITPSGTTIAVAAYVTGGQSYQSLIITRPWLDYVHLHHMLVPSFVHLL